MANLSAGRRLTALTTLVTGLAVVLGLTATTLTQRLGATLTGLVEETAPRQAAAAQLRLRLNEYDSASRALAVAVLRRQGIEEAGRRLAGVEGEVRRSIEATRGAGAEAPALASAFDAIAGAARQAGGAPAGADPAAAEAAYASLDKSVLEPLGAVREQSASLEESAARPWRELRENRAGGGWGLTLLVGLGVFAVAASLAAMVSVRGVQQAVRETVNDLKENARKITATANQVSASSQSVSRAASEQAASLEETSASTEEIHSMTKRNAENAETASNKTNEASRTIQETNQALEEMVASMNQIMTSSNEISKIIKVIDDIAFQTNILALNAAVEAARAGDAGMGFAVVADEVRSLAQRSAQAARDTTQLIEESINRASEGKEKLDQVTRAIKVLTDSSLEAKSLVEQVYAGSQEQARGIAQISRAVLQMEQLTQQLAATAEQSAAAGSGLTTQAHRVDQVVAGLQRAVGHGEDEDHRGSLGGGGLANDRLFSAPSRHEPSPRPKFAPPAPAAKPTAASTAKPGPVKMASAKPAAPQPNPAKPVAAKPAQTRPAAAMPPAPKPAPASDGLRALQSATGKSNAPTVRDGYTDHFAAPAPFDGADHSKLDPKTVLPLDDDDFKPF